MSQTHIRAVNRTINALRLGQDDRYSAVVEVARSLARQMDRSDGDAGTRLAAAYLSALKDLNRATPRDTPATQDNDEDDFDQYLRKCGTKP